MLRPSALVPLLAALLSGCAAAGPRVHEITPDLRVEELRPGLWLHTSWGVVDGTRYPSNGLIVQEGDSLVLVDTAWGEPATERLLQWVESELAAPLRGAVVTHWHDDRTSGIPALRRRGVPVRAHPLTVRLTAEAGRAAPDALEGLDAPGSAVGAGGVEVFYAGPGHTPDNVLVWVPAAGALFGGCAVRERAATSLGNTADADLREWPRSIERALERYGSASIVVPGHGTPGGAELLTHTRSLFR